MLRSRAPTKFVGILGWPLDHTSSPAIHNAAFRQLELNWIYLSWPVPPAYLRAAVDGLRALGALGANVTMPHKESVIEHLDELSGDSRAVGAVNTIQRVGDRLIGHNTDVDGFAEFVTADSGIVVSGRRALVLGSGGAARAVVKALDDLGAKEIAVAARRADKGEKLIELASHALGRTASWNEAEARAGEFDLVVNATPIGSGGDDPLPSAVWNSDQVVVDLVYDPPTTALVERARAAGARAWGGLGMLVHQAATAFRIWTGQEPPIETMSAAALHSIGPHAARGH